MGDVLTDGTGLRVLVSPELVGGGMMYVVALDMPVRAEPRL